MSLRFGGNNWVRQGCGFKVWTALDLNIFVSSLTFWSLWICFPEIQC